MDFYRYQWEEWGVDNPDRFNYFIDINEQFGNINTGDLKKAMVMKQTKYYWDVGIFLLNFIYLTPNHNRKKW